MRANYFDLIDLPSRIDILYPSSLVIGFIDLCKGYMEIDLCGAYNLVRISKGDEWKTHSNHVMVILNMLWYLSALQKFIVFQYLMNDFFHNYLDDFLVCYMNEIFIFSKSLEEHECYVFFVLNKFKEIGLYAKL